MKHMNSSAGIRDPWHGQNIWQQALSTREGGWRERRAGLVILAPAACTGTSTSTMEVREIYSVLLSTEGKNL